MSLSTVESATGSDDVPVLRHDGNAPIHFQNRELNLIEACYGMLPDGLFQLDFVNALMLERCLDNAAVGDQDNGPTLSELLKHRNRLVDARYPQVEEQERHRRDEAAHERGVGANHRVLDGVGYEKDEYEVEWRHLADLALACETKAGEDNDIHNGRTDDDRPPGSSQVKHPRIVPAFGSANAATFPEQGDTDRVWRYIGTFTRVRIMTLLESSNPNHFVVTEAEMPDESQLTAVERAKAHIPEFVPLALAHQTVHGTHALGRFNTWLALKITTSVGSMWCAYAFTLLALISLPAAIKSGDPIIIVAWIAQTFLQLVLLPIIIVGQNVQASATEGRARADHATLNAVHTLTSEVHTINEQQSEILKRLDARPQ